MDEDVSLVIRVTWHEVVGARFKSHESAVVTNVESREQVERLVFRKGLTVLARPVLGAKSDLGRLRLTGRPLALLAARAFADPLHPARERVLHEHVPGFISVVWDQVGGGAGKSNVSAIPAHCNRSCVGVPRQVPRFMPAISRTEPFDAREACTLGSSALHVTDEYVIYVVGVAGNKVSSA